MGFGPTPAQVSSFASQPFIQRALQKPFLISSVLSFFFHVDYQDPSHVQIMREGKTMDTVLEFVYAGGESYDELCRNHFTDTIRSVSKGTFGDDGDKWQTTVDGQMAQILLFDQFSRNAFRGQAEAFAYDEKAMSLARALTRDVFSCDEAEKAAIKEKGLSLPSLQGELYLPYMQFIMSPLLHSEQVEDHALGEKVADFQLDVSPEKLNNVFQMAKEAQAEHKEVVDKFGRYPHRNKSLGRESTPEELEWLADENRPGWAKSQG